MLLEDSIDLARVLVEYLEATGFEVEVANTGAVALRWFSQSSFDVAVVDIDLPDINGFDVVGVAHELGCLRNTKVVFCTGNRSEEYRQRAARFPGSSFLWKPFFLQNLLKCIEGPPATAEPS